MGAEVFGLGLLPRRLSPVFLLHPYRLIKFHAPEAENSIFRLQQSIRPNALDKNFELVIWYKTKSNFNQSTSGNPDFWLRI